ncbi:hypothetical protein HMPREF9554_01263 [Treponema phagedenis F0421]|nr:hypothetical protein HMPREF9554_01263 [Treponema phagedenis F0421]
MSDSFYKIMIHFVLLKSFALAVAMACYKRCFLVQCFGSVVYHISH